MPFGGLCFFAAGLSGRVFRRGLGIRHVKPRWGVVSRVVLLLVEEEFVLNVGLRGSDLTVRKETCSNWLNKFDCQKGSCC